MVFFVVGEGIFLMSAIRECTSREGISETVVVVLGVLSVGVTGIGVSVGVTFFDGMNDLALVDRPNLRENGVSVRTLEGVFGVGDVFSAGVRGNVDLVGEFLVVVDEILLDEDRLDEVLLARTREDLVLLVEILMVSSLLLLLEVFVVTLLFFTRTSSGCVVCGDVTLVTGSCDGLVLLAETLEAVVLTAELGESVVDVVALGESVAFVTGSGVFLLAGICDRELDRSSDVLDLDRRVNMAG